ncbi:transcription factor HES-5 [Protopterus annectens]|uniref:transcription factor HES-5 n=1 Tax=Protopterus annectens TaxID=7888 RepID=UPI001CFBD23B|nr:transcription factor HES-5 [Protopterus annectens]
MAPNSLATEYKEARLTAAEKNKLRKPMVEKMRRDRINSCIEQLKVLLEKEFEKHQGSSKLEKADVLEMTVSYLRQHQQLQLRSVQSFQKSPQQDYMEGYSSCLQETLRFLPIQESKRGMLLKMVNHFYCAPAVAKSSDPPMLSPSPETSQPSLKQIVPNSSISLWRPW